MIDDTHLVVSKYMTHYIMALIYTRDAYNELRFINSLKSKEYLDKANELNQIIQKNMVSALPQELNNEEMRFKLVSDQSSTPRSRIKSPIDAKAVSPINPKTITPTASTSSSKKRKAQDEEKSESPSAGLFHKTLKNTEKASAHIDAHEETYSETHKKMHEVLSQRINQHPIAKLSTKVFCIQDSPQAINQLFLELPKPPFDSIFDNKLLSNQKPPKNCVIAININDKRWVALALTVNQVLQEVQLELDMLDLPQSKPTYKITVTYVDPTHPSERPDQLIMKKLKEHYGISPIQIVTTEECYESTQSKNCSPWTIAILESLAKRTGLPDTKMDLTTIKNAYSPSVPTQEKASSPSPMKR